MAEKIVTGKSRRVLIISIAAISLLAAVGLSLYVLTRPGNTLNQYESLCAAEGEPGPAEGISYNCYKAMENRTQDQSIQN